MITRQEYENAVEVIAQYREQRSGEKSKEIIEKNNPKVFEIIKELNKLGYENTREGKVFRWYDYYVLDFAKYDIALQLRFNKKEIIFNLCFDNDSSPNRLNIIYLSTIGNLELTIKEIEKVIERINRQWQELEPLMEKYDIKKFDIKEFKG